MRGPTQITNPQLVSEPESVPTWETLRTVLGVVAASTVATETASVPEAAHSTSMKLFLHLLTPQHARALHGWVHSTDIRTPHTLKCPWYVHEEKMPTNPASFFLGKADWVPCASVTFISQEPCCWKRSPTAVVTKTDPVARLAPRTAVLCPTT